MLQMTLHIRFLLLFQIFLLGCAPEMNDVIKEWTEKGWSQVRVHGVEGNFTRQGTLMNEKAQALEASWVVNGKRKTKIYSQDSHNYLLLRFFREEGDEFAVVMRKRK